MTAQPATPVERTPGALPTKTGWYLATHIRQRDPEWAEQETHVYVMEVCGELTVADMLSGSDRLEAWSWGLNIDDALRRLVELEREKKMRDACSGTLVDALLVADVEIERLRNAAATSGLDGIDNDPERWSALHDPMLQSVYAWRAEQLREGDQAFTTVPFMSMVNALRDFREKVITSAASTLVAQRDAAHDLCRRAIKYACEDRMRTPGFTRLQRVLDEMARTIVAPRASSPNTNEPQT